MPTTCEKSGNTWKARYTWTDATGKRHFRRVSSRLREDCQRKLRELMIEAEEGPARMPTLAEYAAGWLATIRATRKPATFNVHESRMRTHVLPALGHRALDTITPRDLTELRASLPLSPTSAHGVIVTFAICLNAAVADGLLRRSPNKRLGGRPRSQADAYRPDEIARLADALGPVDGVPVLLMAATGLRIGECFGLQWRDLDLGERPSLRVERQRGAGSTGRVVTTPKTPSSRRTIALGPATAAMLSSIPRGGENDWVFPFNRESFSRRLERACRRANIRDLGSHGLRHAYATQALQSGVHPRVVQETLGHSDVAITLNIYAHVADEMRYEAAAVSESIIPCHFRAAAEQVGSVSGSGNGKTGVT